MQDHTSSRSLENTIAAQKYGVGQPVVRKEDDTLVRGKGKYTDDLNLPGQAYAVIVRSTHPHGVLRKVDTTEAKKLPGVLGIWTGGFFALIATRLRLSRQIWDVALTSRRVELLDVKVPARLQVGLAVGHRRALA